MIYSERIQTSQAIYDSLESLDMTVGGFGRWSCNDEIDTIFDGRFSRPFHYCSWNSNWTCNLFIQLDSDQFYFSKYFSHEDDGSVAIETWDQEPLTSTCILSSHIPKKMSLSYHEDLWNNVNQLRIENYHSFQDSQSPELEGSHLFLGEATKKSKELGAGRTKMTCSPTVNAAQSELPAMLLSTGHGPLREECARCRPSHRILGWSRSVTLRHG